MLHLIDGGQEDWEVTVPGLQQPEDRLCHEERPAELLTERLECGHGHHTVAEDDASKGWAASDRKGTEREGGSHCHVPPLYSTTRVYNSRSRFSSMGMIVPSMISLKCSVSRCPRNAASST